MCGDGALPRPGGAKPRLHTTFREPERITTMSTFVDEKPTQNLEPFKGVKKVPHEEYYTSGHRTCQGCESAQIMKLMAKAPALNPSLSIRTTACCSARPRAAFTPLIRPPGRHR